MWWNCGFIGNGPLLSGPSIESESEGTGRRVAVDIEVDSKAMRKWDENMTLAWIVENEPADGTATEIEVITMGRMLIKLA